ncbi:hypothetical protein A176_004814 [Myxococcus hansupus]|uniref:Outer membrane protein beta-barrel domain-containing protein n=1 Tax=Pseudomyxococcus hansupus TaxID=1297742 RepID=A0A0H4XI23_9BACT|nr:hypothetical protein [Myxococcus hansupus]AKQ67902.1 hypothetical protein A176_004814 [Myxococcus hansupus]
MLLLIVPAAAAQGAASDKKGTGSGIAVGVRGSYGVPIGDFYEGFSMDERISGVFAPQVDMGYFVNANVYLGLYGQFGIARLQPDVCPTGVDCGGRVLRFGVDVSYHFFSDSSVRPWLGAGIGYEFTRLDASVEGTHQGSGNYKGLEFAHVDFGMDFKVHAHVWVGPFLTATAGQFSRASLTAGPWEVPVDIESKSPHFWLQPGLRLQVRL